MTGFHVFEEKLRLTTNFNVEKCGNIDTKLYYVEKQELAYETPFYQSIAFCLRVNPI